MQSKKYAIREKIFLVFQGHNRATGSQKTGSSQIKKGVSNKRLLPLFLTITFAKGEGFELTLSWLPVVLPLLKKHSVTSNPVNICYQSFMTILFAMSPKTLIL